MSEERRAIPHVCPVSGEALHVSELSNESGTVTIRGEFALPNLHRLDDDQQALLEAFLRARGTIATMERELSLSYPTLRNRIDEMIAALGLEPYKEPKKPKTEKKNGTRAKILDALERGELTAEEAKAKLKEHSN